MEKQDPSADHVQLTFSGSSGQEAEAFVQAVQRRAHAAGKLRDNDWIVDLVSVCFEGDALRWFESLDDKTQGDWKLMKAAILRQYPPGSGAGPSLFSGNNADTAPPTYEAALVGIVETPSETDLQRSMSRPLPPPPAPEAPPAPVLRTGRLRVVSTSKSLCGYVSCKLPAYGCFELTKHENKALRVMYDENQAGGLFSLTLLDCNSNLEWLGVSWIQNQPSLMKGSTDYAYLSAVGGDPSNLSSSCKWRGPRQSRVWGLTADMTLYTSWWGWSGLVYPLQVLIKSKNVLLAADAPAAWASEKPGTPFPQTRLVFEHDAY